MVEVIGWLSSMILVLTIGKQVHKQWRDRTSQGVSKWLFVGQIAASAGFTVYSWLVDNGVFVVTNAIMLVAATVGLSIVIRHRLDREGRPRANGASAENAAEGLEADMSRATADGQSPAGDVRTASTSAQSSAST